MRCRDGKWRPSAPYGRNERYAFRHLSLQPRGSPGRRERRALPVEHPQARQASPAVGPEAPHRGQGPLPRRGRDRAPDPRPRSVSLDPNEAQAARSPRSGRFRSCGKGRESLALDAVARRCYLAGARSAPLRPSRPDGMRAGPAVRPNGTSMTAPIDTIRNFSIVAHIDHGKSTLADRLIEVTGTVSQREMGEQMLDSMDIEKERGITIKAQTVRLEYPAKDGRTYILNLMDTPGHVDFAYEVSRSLAACEGSLLVVDASQGVEAQTLANVYQALDANHEIVPVLNKVDLPAAEPDRVKEQIEEVIGLDASEAVPISAKTGLNIEAVLEAIVTKLPPPKGDPKAPLKALLVDSWYDAYLGVVVLVRIVDGVLKKGMTIRMMGADAVYGVDRIGVFRPKMAEIDALGPGEVGFFTGSIKEVADTRVGDTITEDKRQTTDMLPGFKEVQAVVFCGLFPVDAAEFENLRSAMGKLRLNDASFSYEMETSAALGFGFRCGFLGLLHLEIIQERLEREFNLDLISTAPSWSTACRCATAPPRNCTTRPTCRT
ncbi:hypothetical protein Lal_00041198 [Lupinus albus]|nr:hypothetical protein Lal_00041198 [Lupinus albus]